MGWGEMVTLEGACNAAHLLLPLPPHLPHRHPQPRLAHHHHHHHHPPCTPAQVWLGSFPVVINAWAAIAITVYYAATLGVMYYTRATAHLKSMWFSSVRGGVDHWGAPGMVVMVWRCLPASQPKPKPNPPLSYPN